MLVQIAIIRDDRLGSNFFILKISVSFLWDENSTNSNEDVCIEHLEQLEKKQKIESIVVLIVTELN